MAERMTRIHLPSLGPSGGWAEYGRREPAHMIHIIRRRAQIAQEEAERILAAADEEFVVETYTGIIVQRNREQLWPPREEG